MSSYKPSGKTTASGFDIQEPQPLPNSAFANAFQPTALQVYEYSDRVIINCDTGSVHLAFSTTASVGEVIDKATFTGASNKVGTVFTFATGSAGGVHVKAGEGQIIDLPVSACVFSGSEGASSANVTFVYNGGL